MRSPTLDCALVCVALTVAGRLQETATAPTLEESFESAGIVLDLDGGWCALPAEVGVRNELLEYLLVAPHGAVHESLFFTSVDAQVLNTALLTLGVEPGSNAIWTAREPRPTAEELRAGIRPYEVSQPAGEGFYLYAGWREGDEVFFYRAEDLVRDLARQRSMQRHRWVYLGSRLIPHREHGEVFAAAAEGNLINIALFSQGNTLVTAALEQCLEQNIWLANAWLLPPRESEVMLVLSVERLGAPPSALAARLPALGEPEED